MRYPGRALRCLGLEVRASDLLADNRTYAYLNIPHYYYRVTGIDDSCNTITTSPSTDQHKNLPHRISTHGDHNPNLYDDEEGRNPPSPLLGATQGRIARSPSTWRRLGGGRRRWRWRRTTRRARTWPKPPPLYNNHERLN